LFPSLRFRHQNPVYTSTLLHACCMFFHLKSSSFDHPNDI
jgi:hypothetical protein